MQNTKGLQDFSKSIIFMKRYIVNSNINYKTFLAILESNSLWLLVTRFLSLLEKLELGALTYASLFINLFICVINILTFIQVNFIFYIKVW